MIMHSIELCVETQFVINLKLNLVIFWTTNNLVPDLCSSVHDKANCCHTILFLENVDIGKYFFVNQFYSILFIIYLNKIALFGVTGFPNTLEENEERMMIDPSSRDDAKVKELIQVSLPSYYIIYKHHFERKKQ